MSGEIDNSPANTTKCLLFIANLSAQVKRKEDKSVFIIDDNINDEILDEEDERAVEAAKKLEQFKKSIIDSYI